MKQIVLATGNAGKAREIRALLKDYPVDFVMMTDIEGAPDVVEDAPTLEGNAAKKAAALAAHTGLPALADDTGLEVAALDGRPGVYTARYAGPQCSAQDNRTKLLHELDGQANRAAMFRTVLAYEEGGEVRYFEGACEGQIDTEERGEGGFGYDAVFVPAGESRTFAQLSAEEKNRISHRGRALQKFVAFITDGLD